MTRWVTSSQQSEQFVSSVIAGSFLGFGEQTPGSIERVIFSPPVAEQLVLDPSSTLVECGVGQLHHMKGIGHQDGARQHVGEDGSVGTRESQGGVAHVSEPLMALGLEPRSGFFPTAPWHDVEELRSAHVDD